MCPPVSNVASLLRWQNAVLVRKLESIGMGDIFVVHEVLALLAISRFERLSCAI